MFDGPSNDSIIDCEGPQFVLRGRSSPFGRVSVPGLGDSVSCMRKLLAHEWGNAVFIILGILSAGMGLDGFLKSSKFIDGGVTGISMLLANVLGWPLPLLILIFNLPFITLGYRQIGRDFAIRSALAIVGLSICLAIVHYPDVTHDDVLTAVFGGFFIGVGMGLAIRGGAVLDGTDIAALLISKRSYIFRVGDIILAMNVVIFLSAARFLGRDVAMYSILTYVAASKTVDFILHGIEQYNAITLISEQSDAIRQAITDTLGRGVTVYKGRGGKSGAEQDILLCVVTRLEIGKVMEIAHRLDKGAFVIVQPLADARGGVLKRRSHH